MSTHIRRGPEELAIDLLGKPLSRLSASERKVLTSISRRELLDDPIAGADPDEAPFGEWLADRVAAVGGSWGFIVSFTVLLLVWMLVNTTLSDELGVRFDPYPYIFLNLMLSMLAAVQAPIIMMSQNRQAEKDRKEAQHDYEVNMRAELEIIRLHEKIDRLMGEVEELRQR